MSYTIKEAAEIMNVPPTTLRYYGTETGRRKADG